jgi:hypothetical protein
MEAEKPAKRNTTKVKQKNVKESKLQSTERRRNKKQKQTERKEVDEPAPGGIYMRQDDECDTGDEGDDWDRDTGDEGDDWDGFSDQRSQNSGDQGDDRGDVHKYVIDFERMSTPDLVAGIADLNAELAKRRAWYSSAWAHMENNYPN